MLLEIFMFCSSFVLSFSAYFLSFFFPSFFLSFFLCFFSVSFFLPFLLSLHIFFRSYFLLALFLSFLFTPFLSFSLSFLFTLFLSFFLSFKLCPSLTSISLILQPNPLSKEKKKDSTNLPNNRIRSLTPPNCTPPTFYYPCTPHYLLYPNVVFIIILTVQDGFPFDFFDPFFLFFIFQWHPFFLTTPSTVFTSYQHFTVFLVYLYVTLPYSCLASPVITGSRFQTGLAGKGQSFRPFVMSTPAVGPVLSLSSFPDNLPVQRSVCSSRWLQWQMDSTKAVQGMCLGAEENGEKNGKHRGFVNSVTGEKRKRRR